MNTWFSSDHHYFHRNILYLCNRPFKDLDEMHHELKTRWNSKIQSNDLVYYLGDFSFGQETSTRKILSDLNGKIHLIVGNHDRLKKLPKERFESIQETLTISLFQNNDTLLCHYPFRGTVEELKDAEENGYKIRYLEKRPVNKGQNLIHGHTHDKLYKIKGRAVNVSVEQWDYYPAHIDEIKALLLAKKDILVPKKGFNNNY